MNIEQAYNILGIDSNTIYDYARSRFRDLAKQYHPDKGGSKHAFQQINNAWSLVKDLLPDKDVLGNPHIYKSYNADLPFVVLKKSDLGYHRWASVIHNYENAPDFEGNWLRYNKIRGGEFHLECTYNILRYYNFQDEDYCLIHGRNCVIDIVSQREFNMRYAGKNMWKVQSNINYNYDSEI